MQRWVQQLVTYKIKLKKKLTFPLCGNMRKFKNSLGSDNQFMDFLVLMHVPQNIDESQA